LINFRGQPATSIRDWSLCQRSFLSPSIRELFPDNGDREGLRNTGIQLRIDMAGYLIRFHHFSCCESFKSRKNYLLWWNIYTTCSIRELYF
jgi:hypothetical protein